MLSYVILNSIKKLLINQMMPCTTHHDEQLVSCEEAHYN